MKKGGTHINRHYKVCSYGYRSKLSHLAFFANALSTSSGVGQCSRTAAREAPLYSRSSTMVERIDVSVHCNLEDTGSNSVVVTGSVPKMVSSR